MREVLNQLKPYLNQFNIFLLLLIAFNAYVGVIICESTAVVDPGDGIQHYNISRWSWSYPELFFSHWGKPLYTTLSSPFSQFGFKGLMILNLLLTNLLAVYLYLLGKALKLLFPIFAVVLCLFAPYYYTVMLAGLTEVLFATLLTIALYYILKQKWVLGAILISFLPFARTEAYFVIPFVGLYYLYHKQIKAALFLAFGMVFYSLLGGIVLGDLLWIINDHPYATGESSVYDSGDFWHFYTNRYKLFGQWNSNLMLVGSGLLVLMMAIKKQSINWQYWLALVLLPALSIFFIHSYFWWQGGYGSAGLLRVLVCILPLVSLLSAYSFNGILLLKTKHQWIKFLALVPIVLFSIHTFNNHERVIKAPIVESEYQICLTQAANQYKKLEEGRNVYYSHPYFAFRGDINHYDQDKVKRLSKNTPKYIHMIQDGCFFQWDSHFCNNELNIPLDSLTKSGELKVVNIFEPIHPLKVLGGHDWRVILLQKNAVEKHEHVIIKDSLRKEVTIQKGASQVLIESQLPQFESNNYQLVKLKLDRHHIGEKTGNIARLTMHIRDNGGQTFMLRHFNLVTKQSKGENGQHAFETYLPKEIPKDAILEIMIDDIQENELSIEKLKLVVSEFR